MGDGRDARTVLVEKPNRKTHTRVRRRWEGNIKMDVQQVGLGRIDCIGLAEEQVACACECGDEPSVSVQSDELLN